MSLRSVSRAIQRIPLRSTFVSAPRMLTSVSSVRIAPRLTLSLKTISTPRYAAFSTSRIARSKEGEVDQELSLKIQSELDMEREMRDSETLPSSIADFLENGPFQIEDTPGQEEVSLTRTFGDETIKVTFSIADLNAMDPDGADPYGNDPALYDDDDVEVAATENHQSSSSASPPAGSAQSGGANTKGSINQGASGGGNFKVAPEDRVAPADREELVNEEDEGQDGSGAAEPSFPARLNVSITKPGAGGTLYVETTAQDGEVAIDSVSFSQNGDASKSGNSIYEGPPFGNLDEDLQLLLERYLDERGINTALALWVPEYIDFKEQREYLRWLGNVKAFVDA